MALGNFTANRQANAVSFILSTPMQSLEDGEETVGVFFVKTDAIVLHGELVEATSQRVSPWVMGVAVKELPMNLYYRWTPWQVVFKGVSNNVLEQLTHLQWIGIKGRQLSNFNTSTRLLDAHFQI